MELRGRRAAVGGAYHVAGNAGSAYFFRRNYGGADHWDEAVLRTASDAAWADEFGFSCAISGDTLVQGLVDLGRLRILTHDRER